MTQATETQAPAKRKRATKPTSTPTATKRAKAPTRAKAQIPTTPEAAAPRGKIGLVVALLKRPDGASVPDMMQATGWQAHSVRGALAGAIKKKLGLKVGSTKTEAGRIYRLERADDAAGR